MTVQNIESTREHLQLANNTRVAHSEIRRQLATGEMAIATALFDPKARTMTIARLLTSQPRWGDKRARVLLSRLEIRETKRVWELTTRQRVLILDALTGDPRHEQ